MNKYRTHTCGELTKLDKEKEISLSGWINKKRDHGNLLFIDLRDNFGITQCVIDKSNEIFKKIEKLSLETVIKITGIVIERSNETINKKITTGEIEVKINNIDILGETKELPMPVFSDQEYAEEIRLKYRFLDLRRKKIHENIILRSKVISFIRDEMKKLGFSKINLDLWHEAIANSTGIILVTGPTGSGKSTTLYATLNLLNKPGVNILTIEDPVEYNMKGIAQGQVNEKAGMTFSAALSSMLRQDPDIIMVGEMRDVATIELAVRAALTGHLVLSTLHTNDTTSSYSRLLDMGIDPFLITSTVRAIIAQRLIRKICTSCRKERAVNEFEQEKYGFNSGEKVFESNNDGCQNCAGNGFRGRCGIYELLIPTHSINEMINNRVSDQEIRTQAINDNMDTLTNEAKRLALNGTTSIDEIIRVL